MEKKKVTYNIGLSLHQRLRLAAAFQDREMVDLIEEALNAYFGLNRMTNIERSELKTYEQVELHGRGQRANLDFSGYSRALDHTGSESAVAADLLKHLEEGGCLSVEVWDGGSYRPLHSFPGTDCLYVYGGQMRLKLTIPGRVRFERLRQRALAESVQEVQPAPSGGAHTAAHLIVQLKSLIGEPTHPLKLNEFLMPLAEEACAKLEASALNNFSDYPTQQNFVARIAAADEATTTLAQLFGIGCAWIDSMQARVFGRVVTRLLSIPRPQGAFHQMWLHVVRYPALRILYSGGIAACSNDSFEVLRHLLIDVKGRTREHQPEMPIVSVLHDGCAFSQDYWNWLPGMERRYTPASDHLCQSLRPVLGEIATNEEDFIERFERFELFQALLHLDINAPSDDFLWAPTGSYIWRRRNSLVNLREEVERAGSNWAPLKAGLFAGSVDRAKQVIAQLEQFQATVRRGRGIF